MPTYEYLCKTCGERFEKVQSFKARPLTRHDTCGGEVHKVFHASGVVFKGPGFYATDNRAASASASANGSASSKDSKTDSARDSKKEAKKAGSTAASSAD